jgi:hypothetical protein
MFDYYDHNGRLDDGSKYCVRVRYMDQRGFQVDDVSITPKGKRAAVFVMGRLEDEYQYRSLSRGDKQKAKLKRFVEVVGEDVLNSALIAAWESKRPEIIKPEDYAV